METTFARKSLPARTIEDYTILHRGRKKMFLNRTGTLIWGQLGERTTARAIADSLRTRYSSQPVPANAVAADVEHFLDGLHEGGLLLKDGIDIAEKTQPVAPRPSENSVTEKAPASGARPRVRSVQEECMTPAVEKQPARSLAEEVDQLYWRKHYIYKMHMELTYRCNFKCVHCYNTTHTGAETEMTTKEWERALDELAGLGCYFLTFTGGEVFVRKDALDILEAAREKGFSFRINTNGSLIDEKLVTRLVAMRAFLQGIDVSFYGGDSQAHDTLACRPGSYEKTLRAVRLLSETELGLSAKFITMRGNFEGIPEFERTMRGLGVKYMIGTESLIPRTDGNRSPLIQLLTDQQYNRLLATQNVEDGSGSSQACKPGHVRGAITPDGSVSPCEWLTDFKLGNLRERPLREIWYGGGFLGFRKVFEEDSDCPTCDLRSGCRRCPAHSYLETGNLLSCAPIQRHNAELFRDSRLSRC